VRKNVIHNNFDNDKHDDSYNCDYIPDRCPVWIHGGSKQMHRMQNVRCCLQRLEHVARRACEDGQGLPSRERQLA
jgi:hypothetical protein